MVSKRTEAPSRIPLATELHFFPTKLDLTCADCGTAAAYAVGAVVLDPAALGSRIEETVCFMGCFRCETCGSIGPWELPSSTSTMILLHANFAAKGEEDGPVLFDGTVIRSGEQAVAHLRGLIAERPESAFLWSRLGNVYRRAGELDEAEAAFRRALQIDATDVESAHSLGELLEEAGAPAQEVGRLYRIVIEHAWEKKSAVADHVLRGCVRSALESLLHLHAVTDGEVEFFAKRSVDPPVTPEETAVLELRSFDLSSDDSWDDLVSVVLREPRTSPEARWSSRRLSSSGLLGPGRESPRYSRLMRNGPCPCGSGRKYKNCCAE